MNRRLLAVVLLILCVATAAACDVRRWPQGVLGVGVQAKASGSTRIVAAGDIACDPLLPEFNGGLGTATSCAMGRTAALAAGLSPDLVLVLGDLQYYVGGASAIAQSYDRSWGQFKTKSRPTIGNHDYLTGNGGPYWTYWGAAAGTGGQGWHSFEAGAWHVISLNSNCDRVDCTATGAQAAWLRSDLAANPAACTLAMWHHPRFSSGVHGANPELQDLWATLANARVDVVLNGHDHNYERLLRLDGTGAPANNGIQSFVVGTGGYDLRSAGVLDPRSAVFFSTFGVLKLDLRADRYDWSFVPLQGGTGAADSGSANCV